MENFIDQFAFIKILKGRGESGLFYDGMQNNYNLEKGSDYEKYMVGASWEECPCETINQLPIGTMFIGVTKSDSAAREYIVIGKDQQGNGIWYPINGPESAEPVVQIWQYDADKKDFVKLFRSELSVIGMKIKELCEPNKFYASTDINGYLAPVFGVYNQPDDDDWSDDDDEDDELREEDKEVLRALSDITNDDDEDDDDDTDFDQTDCIFTVIKTGEKTVAMTIANGIGLDDEVEEVHHLLHHALEDLEHIKHRIEVLRNEMEEKQDISEQFTAVYEQFVEDSKGINIESGIQTVDAQVVDDEVPDLNVPVQPVEDAEEPAEEVETIESKAPEMTEEEKKINRELADATGIPESDTSVKIIKLPKNSEDFEIKETAITRAFKEKIDTEIPKADTDGEPEDVKPADYNEATTKPNQDFGDW